MFADHGQAAVLVRRWHKIIYGSEARCSTSRGRVRAFMDFQSPMTVRGLRLAAAHRPCQAQILGENLLRLHGMDLAERGARASAKP